MIEIKVASVDDMLIIQKIGRETFIETFQSRNEEADMNDYISNRFSDHQVHDELKNLESIFYIAWDQENPIGYLKLNIGNAQTEIKLEDHIEIERIYVYASHHGKQVGQLLFFKALETAKNLRVPTIWLGVWEENARAISFYKKNGFEEFDKHIFKLGSDEQTDILMKRAVV
ncbi:GNAT family N-acetyltransferase [Sphingobacterium cellulitidis]|uniref:N-acetyltransferase n=1 Tax=Sphingobacterium cellulitidis TaxID=1768011 RepID=A0A8H9KX60_9SPHI|nr:GNAT family N-acetyltransferase [Sphingobacterium soli]MBA8988391.1 ribosomal protein S18 acetylase RimI-like enzyme [Sphingobacterium soli]OYD42416.1 GNAT family N-acetyltransferase [Sphingobacterium cellulitidis]GGE31624.1 N-acetyltransferase [Sphingobacterium soli]